MLANSSPIIALNRIWALSKVHGNSKAIEEAKRLNLERNHFYFVLLAELYRKMDKRKSIECFKQAQKFCKTDTEKAMIQKQIDKLS